MTNIWHRKRLDSSKRFAASTRRAGRDRRSAGAFTLIELLIVVAIIAILISLLLPALAQGREQSRKVKCLANLRDIGVGLSMYRDEQNNEIPWIHPSQQASIISQFVFGGFIAPMPDPAFGTNIDYMKHLAEDRPLNKFVAPGITGNDTIETYICPGDRTRGFGTIGSLPGYTVSPDDWQSSWKAAGNSYAINWWWMNYYRPNGFNTSQMKQHSNKMLHELVGGKASTFGVIYESFCHQIFQDATATGGGFRVRGWHRQFSRHSILFLDGHSENRYMDTRYPFGSGWSIWPKAAPPNS